MPSWCGPNDVLTEQCGWVNGLASFCPIGRLCCDPTFKICVLPQDWDPLVCGGQAAGSNGNNNPILIVTPAPIYVQPPVAPVTATPTLGPPLTPTTTLSITPILHWSVGTARDGLLHPCLLGVDRTMRLSDWAALLRPHVQDMRAASGFRSHSLHHRYALHRTRVSIWACLDSCMMCRASLHQ
jgi:hypothetical protein